MKTISIAEIHNLVPSGMRKYVVFSDRKQYEATLVSRDSAWDCTLRLMSSKRTVTSPLRRKMVLDYLGLESAVTRKEKTHVDNLRRGLCRYGFLLNKSHVSKRPHASNHGGYRVTDRDGETAIGHWYSATLEQVEEFLATKAAEFRVDE